MKNKQMKKLKLCLLGLMLTGISYGQTNISPSDTNCTYITDTVYYSTSDLDSIFNWYLGNYTVDSGAWEWTIMQDEAIILLDVVNNVIYNPKGEFRTTEEWWNLYDVRDILCYRINCNPSY